VAGRAKGCKTDARIWFGVINLSQTAPGLTMPPPLLATADEVIKQGAECPLWVISGHGVPNL
jgi:hypothetical protein